MACHGGFSLDESARREWFNPEKMLEDIGLREGMVFVDVGCGQGFYTLLAAERVGKTGKVYAVDADAPAIEQLKSKLAEKGLTNVTAKAARAEETVFCDECADTVFYSIVFHDFHDAAKVLANANRMLKPSGKLVNIDWKKEPMEHGPPLRIRVSEQEAQRLIEAAGFKIETVRDAGRNHYVITAKKTAPVSMDTKKE
jgi:ubiquinone/menaquinone biosynthesis C-methylase UbiE